MAAIDFSADFHDNVMSTVLALLFRISLMGNFDGGLRYMLKLDKNYMGLKFEGGKP